ncbi:DNA polymerase [Klebsiella phage CPRSB]|nr:DNA polymerase [Klebsiella phage CPRSB]
MVLPLRDKNPWQADCIAWQSGNRLPAEIESDILAWVDYPVCLKNMLLVH